MNSLLKKFTKEEQEQVIFTAVCNTLETVAFEEPIPFIEEQPLPQDGIGAKIAFVTPVSGELSILMTLQAARQLAMSVAGVFDESEIKQEAMLDVVAELANVLAGQLAKDLFVDSESYTLGLPTTWIGKVFASKPIDCYLFKLGDELFAVQVRLASIEDR